MIPRLGSLVCVALASAQALGQVVGEVPAEPAYRKYFTRYNQGRQLAAASLEAVGLRDADVGRTFVLIAGISEYPAMPAGERQLPPADQDMQKLEAYFRGAGGADEIVVLKNEAFDLDNLNYFMETYFPSELAKNPHSRFIFAYSGHGVTRNKRGYLLLQRARTFDDNAATLNVGLLHTMLEPVVAAGHQVLVLLNSCYGGSLIRDSFGARNYVARERGAHAITAGGPDELTWSEGAVGPGSIFFERFLTAVAGAADTLPKDAETGRAGDGVVTVSELYSYMQTTISEIEKGHQIPRMGDLVEEGSAGGMFFVVSGFSAPQNPGGRGVPIGFGPASAADFSLMLATGGAEAVLTVPVTSSEYHLDLGSLTSDSRVTSLILVSNISTANRELAFGPMPPGISAQWSPAMRGGGQTIDVPARGTAPLSISVKPVLNRTADRLAVQVGIRKVFDIVVDYKLRDKSIRRSQASGMQQSGAAKEWSGPYKVCLGAAPEGYTLNPESVSMSLTGDRRCNQFATCTLTKADDTGVCMDFTLQGHDEAPPMVRESEGHIAAVYRLVLSEPTLK